MATRLKTIEYSFKTLTGVTHDTLTNFDQITIYVPESGVTFKSVELRLTIQDVNTTTTSVGYTSRSVGLRLGNVGYSTITNSNTLLSSGENLSILLHRNYTSYFVTNWTGTSMTCDVTIQVAMETAYDQSNACARLFITYEYDDTSSTHVKTVYIPLNAPVTSIGTSRPESVLDTIPLLDTYLPEDSKLYRDIFIWFGANTHSTTTADLYVSHQIDAGDEEITGVYTGAMTSARWVEYIYKPTFTTNATHEYRTWISTGDIARFNTPQIYLVVTYEFLPSSSTHVMNCVLLPMEWESPAGGTSANDFQRATRELFIQESGVTLTRLALYINYEAPISTSNFVRIRIGTGSWIQYTSIGAVVCGQLGYMIRNDDSLTISRGRNVLQADMYSSSANATPFNISSLWVINYTSLKHDNGVGVHNHTVFNNIYTHGTTAAILRTMSSSVPMIEIPETYYYMISAGFIFEWMSNSTVNPTGVIITAEKLSSEGGLEWSSVYVDPNACDPEVGIHTNYAQARYLFKRFTGDFDDNRKNIQTARRFRTHIPNIALTAASAWHERLTSIITYHNITYTVSGNISGSYGGTVNIFLIRENNNEILLSTSRVGNGSYTFTWYDNTENIYVMAKEDNTYKGISKSGIVGTDYDINLMGSGGEYGYAF